MPSDDSIRQTPQAAAYTPPAGYALVPAAAAVAKAAPDEDRVRIDKKLQPAFLLALILQAAGLVYYGAQTTFTLGDHARRIVTLEARSDEHAKQIGGLMLDLTQRLVRIEARLQVQQTTPQRERD